MITIRLRSEVSSPTGEWMQSLPKLTEELVLFGGGEVLAIFEKVKVDGETEFVERVPYPSAIVRVAEGLLRAAKRIAEG